MELKIRELQESDYDLCCKFAEVGMNFEEVTGSKELAKKYGWYFWYSELIEATQIIACSYGNDLAGVLVTSFKGEKKKYRKLKYVLQIKIANWKIKHIAGSQSNRYNEVNQVMEEKYSKILHPDGQIVFLAANPFLNIKGVGSFLLDELERRNKGKEIYLFTDSQCTYQFYEHRGFERYLEEEIDLPLSQDNGTIKCFLYRKKVEE